MKKPYDVRIDSDNLSGFYEWNKRRFLLKKGDQREQKFEKFRKKNGFTPDECWALDTSICIFVLPRLKYFREKVAQVGCYPSELKDIDEWLGILDKMIYAFQWMIDDEKIDYTNKEQSEKVFGGINQGLRLFCEYFRALWW